MARTADEILSDISSLMGSAFGNNPLSNASQYPTNNLVVLGRIFAQSTRLLEERFDTLKYLSRVDQLSGSLLTTAAADKCIFRRECVTAKQLMIFNGSPCATVSSGTEFQDLSGRTWLLSGDVTLENIGGGCATATGIVESDVCECRDPDAGTISPIEALDGISAATNLLLLERGGASESDSDLRNRITSAGPLAHIQGTQDYAEARILELTGVNYVETVQPGQFGLDGFSYIVHGGDDAEICNAIARNSGNSAKLLGDTTCDAGCFNDVRFQRPVPVIIDVNVCIPLECSSITASQAEQYIRNTSLDIVRKEKIRAFDFAKIHDDIDKVTFTVTFPPLITCDSGITYTDPIDGSEVDFFGQSRCEGIQTGCSNCPQENQTSLNLRPWQYVIIGDVNVTECSDEDSQC